jgi:hypothetical protein
MDCVSRAVQVAAVLQNLARGGRTVLCSVEKPCQLVVSHFSDLMLLGAGLLVYSGKADAVATYFANIGECIFVETSVLLTLTVASLYPVPFLFLYVQDSSAPCIKTTWISSWT